MPPPADPAATPGARVAARFRRLAHLLEIEGANPSRVRADRRAALTVERLGPRLPEPLARPDAHSALDAPRPSANAEVSIIFPRNY